MSHLNPYIGLDQFNTGIDSQSQIMQRQQQLALEQQAQELRRQSMLQDANQFEQGMNLHRDQLNQSGRQFDASHQLGLDRFHLDQQQQQDRVNQQAYQMHQDAAERQALSRYAENMASELEQEHGIGSMDLGGGMAGPPVPDENGMMPQVAKPSRDQDFAKSITGQMRSLANAGLPASAAMAHIKELADIGRQAARKRQQIAVLRSKGGRTANAIADGIEADLDQTTLQLYTREAAAGAPIDTGSPAAQQQIQALMARDPHLTPEQAQAFFVTRKGGLTNQLATNRTNRVIDPEQATLTSQIRALTSKKYWDFDPEALKTVNALQAKLIGVINRQQLAGGEDEPETSPLDGGPGEEAAEEVRSGKVVIPLNPTQVASLARQINDEMLRKGIQPTPEAITAEIERRSGARK